MMLGYSNDPGLEGDSGNKGVSSPVSAVVNIYGVYEMTTRLQRTATRLATFSWANPSTRRASCTSNRRRDFIWTKPTRPS